MDNQDTRGPGRNKRKWNHDEDVKLIQTLLDMVNLGAFKAENGFKPGYLTYLEDKLNVILPNSELKAKPHIESRIKVLKRDFNIVYDMLNGPNTSGFGMDPIKKCVTAEKPVWDAYLKVCIKCFLIFLYYYFISIYTNIFYFCRVIQVIQFGKINRFLFMMTCSSFLGKIGQQELMLKVRMI